MDKDLFGIGPLPGAIQGLGRAQDGAVRRREGRGAFLTKNLHSVRFFTCRGGRSYAKMVVIFWWRRAPPKSP